VSNAGMYDGATSAAEAALMACAITGRSKVAVLSSVHPAYREVLHTYCRGKGLPLVTVQPDSESMPADLVCLIVQQPNFFGHFEPVEEYVQKAHDVGALLIAIVDPTSLGMFRPPGEYGADIAVAEGQPLGIPTSFGGPYLGIFACRKDYIRRMPGRIVGKTVDVDGNPGYVMTLVTREQYIRRERATSNICTSQALMALAAAVYLAALGKRGLRQVAELCYHKAHYAAEAISRLKGYSLAFPQPFFKEFTVRCPLPPAEINKALFKERIMGGLDISHLVENGMLICVTEMNSRQEIDRLVKILGSL
jgi:glycine dehydrogenase subunit 1